MHDPASFWYNNGMEVIAVPKELNPIRIGHSIRVGEVLTFYHRSGLLPGKPYPEIYPFWQVTFLLSGRGTYSAGGESWPFSSGEVLFRRPDRETCVEYDAEVPVSFAIISFTCEFMSPDPFPVRPVRLYGEERATLLDLIRTGVRVCEPMRAGDARRGFSVRPGTPGEVLDFIGVSLERFLLMAACRLKGITLLTDESEKSNRYAAESGTAASLRRYLETHICEPVRIPELAQEFRMSATALMKLYKREFGVPILEDHTRLRLAYAKRRIAHGTSNFAQIAEELGYSSQGYFSRVFRAHEGISPTEYSRMVSKRGFPGIDANGKPMV